MAKESWDWPTFLKAFWPGFGRMMAGFIVLLLVLHFGWDVTPIGLDDAVVGLLLGAVVSAIYGYSEGATAVCAWRENSN